MTTVEVFVPSTMRWNRVKPKFGTLVVHRMEAERYRALHMERKILVHEWGTIGQIRDWLLRVSHADIVFFVDDDVTNENLKEAVEACCEKIADGAAAAGLGAQFMVHVRREKDGDWSKFGYLTKAWGVRRGVYFEMGANMAVYPCHEDTYLACMLGTGGHTYYRSNKYVAQEAANKGGGCDRYRDDRMIVGYMELLAKDFPNHVKIQRTSVSNQGRKLGVSTRVAWSKFDGHRGALESLEKPLRVLW